ncbi:DUF3087 domain-containing protein [Oceanisphaera pacifica]|uniref:DUF3087 domain-containing protein n=1 Tax=Oceanisphaera pacifica TaxID=2818389 RepID=A0ABS3NDH8_9GAMM|nr:DUF3087 domain-containing protein [Oceanisphaera pacifica]MBO1518653.1 DUF3087 domain-containing protein [Oceanisphaera pacifica]
MKLIAVDKERYRKHFNRLLFGCAVCLAVCSLVISYTLIALFPDPSGSHFHWNAIGVLISAALVGGALYHYRHHEYLTEVYYVWRLKQSLNKITRKMRKVEAAAKQGNPDAMLILQYSYSGSRLLWKLDDNTLIMDELAVKQTELNNLAEKYNITLDVDNYDEQLLAKI